jgi:hypothetical protein
MLNIWSFTNAYDIIYTYCVCVVLRNSAKFFFMIFMYFRDSVIMKVLFCLYIILGIEMELSYLFYYICREQRRC